MAAPYPLGGVAGGSLAAGGSSLAGAGGSSLAVAVAGAYNVSAYSGTPGVGGAVTLTGAGSLPAEAKSCIDLADYYDVSQSWAQVNEAGGSGRKVGDHHHLNYVNGDTPFRVEIMNDSQVSFFKELRGRFFTPIRVFVGHPTVDTDKQEIEIMMSYPEAIAKSKEDIRIVWVKALGSDARDFYRVLYWDLWTWENAEPHYHDIYCSLDDVK